MKTQKQLLFLFSFLITCQLIVSQDFTQDLRLINDNNAYDAGRIIHFTSYNTTYSGPRIRSSLQFASGGQTKSKLILSSYWNDLYKDEITLMNGFVGIGNNSPSRSLDVNGVIRSPQTEYFVSGKTIGFIGHGSSYTSGWASLPDIMTITYESTDLAIGGWAKDGSGWKGASLFINSNNGFVGLGTTNPSQRLSVKGDIVLFPSTNTANGLIGRLNFSPGDTYNGAFRSASIASYFQGPNWYSGTKLAFYTNPGPDITMKDPIERMTIDKDGNVGIGNNSPSRSLDVNGVIRSPQTEYFVSGKTIGFIGHGSSYTSGWASLPDIMTITYESTDLAIGGWAKDGSGWKGASLFINSNNGFVGLGTTDPKNRLDVNGTIHAREVKVDLAGWSDFVFAPTYKLRSLSEVEQHIKEKGHLPEIPSAKEVEEQGVNVGDMQAKMMQKIEELTLYMIELQKQNEAQNEEIKILKSEISKNK